MAINFKFPLRRGSKGAFATNDSTIDAVIDDLKILILSNHGERPIHGDFGANLRSIAFESGATILTKAEDLILAAVEKWMPFVTVVEIQAFNSSNDVTVRENEIRVKIRFEVGQIEGVLDQRIRN